MLGAQPQEVSRPPELEKIMENAEYLVIDLVLNWVADGLLLAFFHAIKDRDPQANNDPQRKHEGWSNYCGAGTMFPEEVSQASLCCGDVTDRAANTGAATGGCVERRPSRTDTVSADACLPAASDGRAAPAAKSSLLVATPAATQRARAR